MIELFILLMIGHCVADFALQGEAMAKGKNRNIPADPDMIPPGQAMAPTWGYWLTAHGGVHAAAVFLITGSIIAACIELVAHMMIDFGKCESWYGIHLDQALHTFTKAAIVLLISMEIV